MVALLLLCVRALPTVFLFFFFSSRRRHTRSKRDWSSDVCSSDLPTGPSHDMAVAERAPQTRRPHYSWFVRQPCALTLRSEERSVGKEWWPLVWPITKTNYTIIGEKHSRSLEGMLATPIRTWALQL